MVGVGLLRLCYPFCCAAIRAPRVSWEAVSCWAGLPAGGCAGMACGGWGTVLLTIGIPAAWLMPLGAVGREAGRVLGLLGGLYAAGGSGRRRRWH